jgi:hypothetical protein
LYGGGWYDTGYAPSNYLMLHDQPAYAYPPGPYPAGFPAQPAAAPSAPIAVIVYRPGCSTDIESAPGRDGYERSLRIVRC